jgi:hypothetical protein
MLAVQQFGTGPRHCVDSQTERYKSCIIFFDEKRRKNHINPTLYVSSLAGMCRVLSCDGFIRTEVDLIGMQRA